MDIGTAMQNLNWLSIIVAALSAFILGGIWYGPLFGKAWMIEFNISEEDIKNSNPVKKFGIAFLLTFIAAFMLEMFIGPVADVTYGTIAGFFAGFGWVVTFIGILYLFEMRSLRAFIINGGYCLLSLTIMGAILGAW